MSGVTATPPWFERGGGRKKGELGEWSARQLAAWDSG